MKHINLIILVLLIHSTVFAHETNKAFFKFEQKEDTVEVVAEFPWTVRNALLKFAPELNNSKSQDAYNTAFFNYVKSTLILIDNRNIPLELISVKPFNKKEHSHQSDFIFTYKGSVFSKVSNTLLFNLDHGQINRNDVSITNKSQQFFTNKSQKTFEIINEHTANTNYLWLFIFLALPIALIRKFFNLKKA